MKKSTIKTEKTKLNVKTTIQLNGWLIISDHEPQ